MNCEGIIPGARLSAGTADREIETVIEGKTARDEKPGAGS